MGAVRIADIEGALFSGIKSKLWRLFCNQTTPLASSFRAMVLADWYGDLEGAKEEFLLCPTGEEDPYGVFAKGYAYMAMGDAAGLKEAFARLQQFPNRPKYLGQWLAIEYAGRARDFELQAELIKKALKADNQANRWLFGAIFRSLDQENIESKPILSALKNVKVKSDIFELLLWRLNIDAKISIQRERIEALRAKYNGSLPILIQYSAFLSNAGFAKDALATLDLVATNDGLDAGTMGRWLSLLLSYPDSTENTEKRLLLAFGLVPDRLRHRGVIASYLLLYYWTTGRYADAYSVVSAYHTFLDLTDSKIDKMARIFFRYVLNLCVHWQNNKALYIGDGHPIYVIGESHSLSPSNTFFKIKGETFRAISKFIMGIKMHHLSSKNNNIYKECFVAHIDTISNGSSVLITIGEIDCRPDEGIWSYAQKNNRDPKDVAAVTVEGYFLFLDEVLAKRNINSVTIQGVPAPGYDLEDEKDPGDKKGFLEMIRCVNSLIRDMSIARGWNFLDVYSATVDENGVSNKKWHIDGYHLKPSFYQEADKWLK